MRYGYWLPVFGGWLRNVPDEGMSATWDYVKKLAQRSQCPAMTSRGFQDLIVWQKAHSWVLNVYRMTELFPRHELFGLTSRC